MFFIRVIVMLEHGGQTRKWLMNFFAARNIRYSLITSLNSF